jgi:PTH2 family peptidyl-tRNA hydrolase
MNDKIKQVIMIRKDLKMRRGKEIAQGAHASIAFLKNNICDPPLWSNEIYNHHIILTKQWLEWFESGQTKICLICDSEEQLLEIDRKAKEIGIESHIITDSGKTEFNGIPTKTCLALGPDYSSKIDRITKDLKLY